MRERASNFGTAQRPAENGERKRNQDRCECQQCRQRLPQLTPARSSKKRGAHPIERIRNWNHSRENLQRSWQHRYRIHHPAHQTRHAQHEPLSRISALEQNLIACREYPKSCERENGRQQNRQCSEPVCAARCEAKKYRPQSQVNARAQCERHEWINCRARENHWYRSLRDQQRLQRAVLSRLLKAGIESGHRNAQVIEKREPNEREREITLPCGKSALQLRTIYETRKVEESRHAEKF